MRPDWVSVVWCDFTSTHVVSTGDRLTHANFRLSHFTWVASKVSGDFFIDVNHVDVKYVDIKYVEAKLKHGQLGKILRPD